MEIKIGGFKTELRVEELHLLPDVAYLRLHAKTAQVETLHLSDELNVDIAPDGNV